MNERFFDQATGGEQESCQPEETKDKKTLEMEAKKWFECLNIARSTFTASGRRKKRKKTARDGRNTSGGNSKEKDL